MFALHIAGFARSSRTLHPPCKPRPKRSRFAGLWAAVTLPTHRRRGIYSALVAARALEAARRGFDFVMVDARAESSLILKHMGFLCVAASHACVWTQGAAR